MCIKIFGGMYLQKYPQQDPWMTLLMYKYPFNFFFLITSIKLRVVNGASLLS